MLSSNLSYLHPYKKFEILSVVQHALDVCNAIELIKLGGSYAPLRYKKNPYPLSPVIELLIVTSSQQAKFELESLWSWDKTIFCGWYKPCARTLKLHVMSHNDYYLNGIKDHMLRETFNCGVRIYSSREELVLQ